MENSVPPARRPVTQAQLEALFREATAIVRVEFARPITLNAVARSLASSPRQLRRAFAEVGGTSFRSFLKEVRMARAAELLASTDLAIREISKRVGYRQPGQFGKAFKRLHSETPSEYRASRRESP